MRIISERDKLMTTVQLQNFCKQDVGRIKTLISDIEPSIANNITKEIDNMKNLASDFYGVYGRKMKNGDIAILGKAGVYRGAAKPILVDKLIIFQKDGTVKEKFTTLDDYNEKRVVSYTKSTVKNGIDKIVSFVRKHFINENKKQSVKLYAIERRLTTSDKVKDYMWVDDSLNGMKVEQSYGSISKYYQEVNKRTLSDGSREYWHENVLNK